MTLMLKLSQLGGLVENIGNWFSTFIETIVFALLGWLYSTFIVPLLAIVDIVNFLFRKFAGLGAYTNRETNTIMKDDFVYSIITSDAIMNVFWSMIILAVVLLLITTFVAVIKSEFTKISDKNEDNNKAKIIKTSVRAVVNFAVVPVCAILGILIGNALLRAIDGATGGKDGNSLGGRVFVASAYEANAVRRWNNTINVQSDGTFWTGEITTASMHDKSRAEYAAQKFTGKEFNDLTEDERVELANMIDTLFENPYNSTNDSLNSMHYSFLNAKAVTDFYNITGFNFMICFVTASTIGVIMLQVMLGLIKRIFAMATLFVIAPPLVAVTPIKGDIMKDWNKAFVKHVLAAYSSVVAMNMFLIIIKALQNVQFFDWNVDWAVLNFFSAWGADLLNRLAYLLIIIGGLLFVKKVSAEIAGIIGGDDAMKEGMDSSRDYVNKLGRTVGVAGAMVRRATAPIRGIRGLGSAISRSRSGGAGPTPSGGGSPTGGTGGDGGSGGDSPSGSPAPTGGTPIAPSDGGLGTSMPSGGGSGGDGGSPTGGSGGGSPTGGAPRVGSGRGLGMSMISGGGPGGSGVSSTGGSGGDSPTGGSGGGSGGPTPAKEKKSFKERVKTIGRATFGEALNFAIDPKIAEEFSKGYKGVREGDVVKTEYGIKNADDKKKKEEQQKEADMRRQAELNAEAIAPTMAPAIVREVNSARSKKSAATRRKIRELEAEIERLRASGSGGDASRIGELEREIARLKGLAAEALRD